MSEQPVKRVIDHIHYYCPECRTKTLQDAPSLEPGRHFAKCDECDRTYSIYLIPSNNGIVFEER